jgi:hypothetical protein
MTLIKKAAFQPNCVWIPNDAVWRDSQGEHVDPEQTVLLMFDSDGNDGEVFTRSAWESDGPPSFRRRWGDFEYLDEDSFDSTNGQIELLPDLCVVKIDERGYWRDPVVLSRTTRLFGVYVFDRRRHVHICSFTPCYELHFLGSQWDCLPEISDEDREDLWDRIQEGDRQSEPVTYWDKTDIDRFLETGCQVGFLPPVGSNHGGFRLDGITAVTTADALEEVREAYSLCEF